MKKNRTTSTLRDTSTLKGTSTHGLEILRDKYTEKTKTIESELFKYSKVTYENTGSADLLDQVQAMAALANRLDSEESIRTWIARMQQYADETIAAANNRNLRKKHAANEKWWQKLRDRAFKIKECSVSLTGALDKKNLYEAVRLGALLERRVIECDLEVQSAEQNAERGRELSDSMKGRNLARWNTPERQETNEKLRREATRLRALHPSWSSARIAHEIRKLHPTVTLSHRTIVKLVPPKIV
jgi:hypothetical protein